MLSGPPFFSVMFSYAFSTGDCPPIDLVTVNLTTFPASTYFHLPIDDEEDEDIENYERKYLTWVAEPSGSSSPRPLPTDTNVDTEDKGHDVVNLVLANDDLYDILGVTKHSALDKIALRRAYLSRSKVCHPEFVFP